jgi:hypothetical protein
MCKTLVAALLALGLSVPLEAGFAQNASMPWAALTGSNQEKCLKHAPPRDAKHAVAAGSQSSNAQVSASTPGTEKKSTQWVEQRKPDKARR